MVSMRRLERWGLLATIAAACGACAGLLGLDQGVADLDGAVDAAGTEAASGPSDGAGTVSSEGAASRPDATDPGEAGDPIDAVDGSSNNESGASWGMDAAGVDAGGAPVDQGSSDGGALADAPDGEAPPPPQDAGSNQDAGTQDAGSTCTLTACADGCFDTSSDPDHCGSCSRSCPYGAHSEATCSGGACGLACTGGALDCDRNPANGCECSGAISNGALQCNANGTCGHVCEQGYVDCGGRVCSCGAGNRCLSDQTCGACRSALQPCGAASDCCSGTCGVNLTCL
jgi:hypothetical protein